MVECTKGRAVALSATINSTGRWEWVLTFEDDVSLPSTRVSDEDFSTREEALAAGERARAQFASRAG
jgi:hypothetical protein